MTRDSLNTNMASSVLSVQSVAPQQSLYDQILDEIQKLLEALVKTGTRTPEGKKLEARFTTEMSLYFRRLARKFPYSSLASYVNQYKESKESDARKLMGRAVEVGSSDLRITIEGNATKGYELGGTQAAQAVRIKPTFALVDEGAKKWIRKRAAEQVTNIDEVTRDRLARLLVDGVDRGLSVPKIGRLIRTDIMDMSVYRGKLIATTELNESMSEASLQTYKRLAITHKSWSTVGDDRVSEECLANEAQGAIKIDATFSGGKDRPPQHPGCRCTLVPERVR